MSTLQPDSKIIRFANWRFDAHSGDLSDGSTSTRLEPQVAKLLAYFLQHQNQLVSRDELISAVWNNRIVSDDAINRCVSVLRKTLTPEAKEDYIQTVVRRGYISHFPLAPVSAVKELRLRFNRTYSLAALISIVGIFVYVMLKPSIDADDLPINTESKPPVIAVLPFTVDSLDEQSDFFSRGIHEDILTQLAKLQALRVISSTSVRKYRDSPRNLPAIGEQLGADAVLEGRVQIAAQTLRINAQLIDAGSDEHLWAETYDRELTVENIFEIQTEIAVSIASALHAQLSVQDNDQLSIVPTHNIAAYKAYHRAINLPEKIGKYREDPAVLQAFEEAVALDPNFTRAWAEIVAISAFRNFSGREPEMTTRAEQALHKLSVLAPQSADHLYGQASYFYYALRDYDRAHALVSQSIELNPSNIRAIETRSWIERRQGDFEAHLESVRELRKLDPLNEKWYKILLSRLLLTHRYKEFWELAEGPAFPDSLLSSEALSLKRFHHNRDIEEYQQSVRAGCRASTATKGSCGWLAHIAARDYSSALRSADATLEQTYDTGIERRERHQLFTYMLSGDQQALKKKEASWRRQIDASSMSGNASNYARHYFDQALKAAVRGDKIGAEKLLNHYFSHRPLDWAERAELRHEACRIMGLSGRVDSTIKCILDGLHEPSQIVPFFEPYLPFYDSIRTHRLFQEMLRKIDPQTKELKGGRLD